MAIWSRFFGGAASTAAGFGVGSALGPALNPITQAVANEVWEAHPDKPLSPEDAAEAVVRGLLTADAGNTEAHQTGIDDRRFAVLHGLAGEPPGPQQLLELLNRGVLTDAEVTTGLRQSRMRPEWYGAFKALRNVLVPVSDLVRFAVREVFDPGQRAALDLDAEFPSAMLDESRALGLSDESARNYWAAHWQLPSAEQGFEMFHRGELSGAQLDGLLKALDYAPTWRSKLRTLSQRIPPITDMIRFAVREVYDPAQRAALGLDANYPAAFTAEAALHGMSEERARQYWAAHWRLPSAEQAFKMLHRGVIDEPQLLGLLRALDYPALWRSRLNDIAYLVPGRIDLRRMFAAGIIDRAELVRGYGRLGYAPPDAQRMADLAAAVSPGRTGTPVTRAQNQLWTTTHRSYIEAEADDATARQRLALVGLTAAEQTAVLDLWRSERSLIRRQLTPAQIRKAWSRLLINPATGVAWTRQDAVDALVELGYSVADSNTFLDEV